MRHSRVMDLNQHQGFNKLSPLLREIRKLSLDELRILRDFVEREIQNTSLIEEPQDQEIEECRLILGVISRPNELTGPEAVLLGALLLHIQTDLEWFSARQVNSILKSHQVQIANITTTLNSLADNSYVRFEAEEGSQKSYQLTNNGYLHAREVLAEKM